MKFLIAATVLGALGLGSLRLARATSDTPCPSSCTATITCTDDHHCRITCDESGGWVELACEGGTCRVVDSNWPSECCSADTPKCARGGATSCSTPCSAPCESACTTK